MHCIRAVGLTLAWPSQGATQQRSNARASSTTDHSTRTAARPCPAPRPPQSIAQATQQTGNERNAELLREVEAQKADMARLSSQLEQLEAKMAEATAARDRETEEQQQMDVELQQLRTRWARLPALWFAARLVVEGLGRERAPLSSSKPRAVWDVCLPLFDLALPSQSRVRWGRCLLLTAPHPPRASPRRAQGPRRAADGVEPGVTAKRPAGRVRQPPRRVRRQQNHPAGRARGAEPPAL